MNRCSKGPTSHFDHSITHIHNHTHYTMHEWRNCSSMPAKPKNDFHKFIDLRLIVNAVYFSLKVYSKVQFYYGDKKHKSNKKQSQMSTKNVVWCPDQKNKHWALFTFLDERCHAMKSCATHVTVNPIPKQNLSSKLPFQIRADIHTL